MDGVNRWCQPGNDRTVLLAALSRVASRETVESLEALDGDDIAHLRRSLRVHQAPRLFLRTLGGIALHRGGWDGPPILIEKKRARMLLAVLAAHFGTILSRDVALDILWPDADPNAAVNSLNQTVFQLRRFIDAGYKGGESPEYVISTSDQVGLNPELVHTDLAELRRLPAQLGSANWHERHEFASRAIRLVRGEFLADLRYEDWASRQQLAVHAEIREQLLPIARSPATSYEATVSARAAAAILSLDPFDEEAVMALAESMARSGRRAAAREVIVGFVRRMQIDLELDPSPDLVVAARELGVGQVEMELEAS
jgi:LuxR family transcriptional regulator, maltose regulon positive regulatory protein